VELSVFIPTRGRTAYVPISAEETQRFSDIKPTIVCPLNEVGHYSRRWRAVGCPVDGIGPTRQWIIETSPTNGVVMLDDDLYFSYRPNPETTKLERVKDLRPMFSWISDQLDAGFIHGGISARQGNQHIPFNSTDCIRVNNAHFFDRDAYLKQNIRFDVTPVMEDFYVTLSLLLRGFPNRVLYRYCWSQRASGFKGGCSIYRTKELQAAAAEQLFSLFPNFVTVVEKESTSGGALFAGVRKDVNIAWLRAWEARDRSREQGFEALPHVNLRRR